MKWIAIILLETNWRIHHDVTDCWHIVLIHWTSVNFTPLSSRADFVQAILQNGTSCIYRNLRILSRRCSRCWTHRLYRFKNLLTNKTQGGRTDIPSYGLWIFLPLILTMFLYINTSPPSFFRLLMLLYISFLKALSYGCQFSDVKSTLRLVRLHRCVSWTPFPPQ